MSQSTIEIITESGLDPQVVALNNGDFALTPARRVLIGTGLGIGIVGAGGLLADGAVAHAHQQAPDSTDTPHEVVVQAGSTVAEEMSKQGYTMAEIHRDLSRHNIPEEVRDYLNVPAGSSWRPHPDTVAERELRLEGSVTISIEEGGSTFWQKLHNMGLGATSTVEAIFKDNGRTLNWATRAQDGDSIVVDKKYLQNAPQAPDSSYEQPELVELALQGSSIINDLRALGVKKPTSVGIEAVELSGMTEEESEDMQHGDTYRVRASALPESVRESATPVMDTPAEAQEDPIIVTLEQPGDSLSGKLKEFGSDNPTRDAERILDSMELSLEDATQHPVGFEYPIPNDLELSQEPVYAPTSTPLLEAPVESAVDVPVENPPAETPVEPPVETPVVTPAAETPPAEAPRAENIQAELLTDIDSSIAAPRLVAERLIANGGFLTKESAQEIWHLLKTSTAHPEKSEDFQNPEMFIKLPAPSVDLPYVVHPRTCTAELYAKPAGILSTMVSVATLEYLLTQPQWEKYRNMVLESGDLVSGDHKTHGHGDKGDFRSRVITSMGAEIPDGALLNTLSPNYDPEFTIEFLVLLGRTVGPNGKHLFKHIEFQDNYVIDKVNSTLGREMMKYIEGHSEHIHANADVEGETEDGIQGTPNTTSKCTFEYINADPVFIEALMQRRATYPVVTPVPVQPVEDNAAELPEQPTQEELIATAWDMSAEEYINTFNNGERYWVQLQNGSEAVEVPADVQRAVDLVWRLENGASKETVIKALTVALAESGLNNSAMNPRTGDRCLFQINEINKNFVEELGARNGWNIDYHNLQNDMVGCARVAFALYQSDLDFKYSKEFIDEYVDRYGLKLTPEMYEELTQNNPISLGFRAWLMSSKNHGLY